MVWKAKVSQAGKRLQNELLLRDRAGSRRRLRSVEGEQLPSPLLVINAGSGEASHFNGAQGGTACMDEQAWLVGVLNKLPEPAVVRLNDNRTWSGRRGRRGNRSDAHLISKAIHLIAGSRARGSALREKQQGRERTRLEMVRLAQAQANGLCCLDQLKPRLAKQGGDHSGKGDHFHQVMLSHAPEVVPDLVERGEGLKPCPGC
jgi:hypothetical protein